MTLELIGDIPELLAEEFPIGIVNVDDGKESSFEAKTVTVDTTISLSSPLDDDSVALSKSSLLPLPLPLSSSLDEAASDMCYDVYIPVTEHGLLLKLKGSTVAAAAAAAAATATEGDDGLKQVAVFDGYVRHSDGTMGPAEVQQLVQNHGDILMSADGVDLSTDQNSFKHDIMPQLRNLLKGKDSIRFTFANGSAYWQRQQEHEEHMEQEEQQAKMRAMALNEAYEAMEELRKLKLEEEFAETIASGEVINLNRCTLCLRAELQDRQKQRKERPAVEVEEEGDSEKIERPMLKAARSFRLDGSRIKKAKNRMTKTNPCLICGMSTCGRHSCKTFQSEGSTVCVDCSRLFSLDFMMECVHHDEDHHGTTGQTNNSHLDFIVDMYDRVLLVLKFSAQYTNDIADALEHQVKRNNGIGVGSNVTGLVSGITGIVAAATLFTPAGPPLLIASLIFGGTATAVSAGSEAVNYVSEPRKVADKIIAMHGVAKSLLRITGILRDALLRDHIHVDHYLEQAESRTSPSNQQEKLEKVKETLEKDTVKIGQGAGTATAAYVAAATEIGSISATAASTELRVITTARSSRFFSRSASAAMKTARVARFAGGFLSAATIVFEVKDMHSTIQRIQAGNPCEKADMIRAIMKEVKTLPDTDSLHRECENYFAVMAKRRQTERIEEVQSVISQNEDQTLFEEYEQEVETLAQTEEANSSVA